MHGQSGDLLDAIGFHTNHDAPLDSYEKTDLIGGSDESAFDDFILLSNDEVQIVKIKSIIISYAVFINGIQVTYLMEYLKTYMEPCSKILAIIMEFSTLKRTSGLLK